MRTIYAKIELDEEIADQNSETNGIPESAPIPYLEHEFGWLESSGISLVNAFIADNDDTSTRARYINYISEWAMEHAEAVDETDSPMPYAEFCLKRKADVVYTHDEATGILEAFENLLIDNHIVLPSPEDDDREEDNEAALYGSTYSDLLDVVEAILVDVAFRIKTGAEVIPYEYSGTM